MDNNNMMNIQIPTDDDPGMSKKTMAFIAIAIIIALVVGGFFFFKNAFSARVIESKDLVSETLGDISFKRPMQWQKVDSTGDSINSAFTEGGRSLDESNQGMLLSREDLGLNYGDLTEEQKTIISDTFRDRFSDPEVLQNGSCEEVSNIKTDEIEQSSYNVVYTVEAICEKFSGRDLKATIKLIVGIKDDVVHIVGVLASNETWEKSGSALNEILNTVKPAS